DHDAALHAFFAWLQDHSSGTAFDAVGHRVVHGGDRYQEPQRISDDLIATLQQLVPLDPDHLPQALAAIQASRQAYPSIPQVACFDTTFHRHMPSVAQHYALPYELWDQGVRRYGFHGLSYEFIMDALRSADPAAADGRVIIAHLGNGASMAAVQRGIGVDTTMGLTPTGGLVMGTRSGDLDPGVLLYLLQAQRMSPAEVNTLVNQRAGLLGISGSTADMRDLLNQESRDPRAAEAIALFCYQARKFLGALAAVLGGLDTLIFTGGIGEHAAPIRARICAGMDFLGIQLDERRNAAHAPIISRDGSAAIVRVMPTNEDLMIARHTDRLLLERGADHVEV
ncbi:MAG TPA: acetate/propionate family kinase, partial [Roseiflexaceae bacterium]|nr:acetate/propionate family kinase [Roseiflexaceae bacterium]